MTENDKKFGIRWGLAGGVALRTVDEVRVAARWAAETGFDSFWVSQSTAVDPVVALAAIANDIPDLSEVGTSVVPLYGRHPIGLAQMVRTAQSALGGRLTLGIGPSHREPVEGNLGMSWDRPLGYTREFLNGMTPLLAGRPASSEGEQLVTRAELNIDAPDTPILLAALGPNMLKLAGERTAGTTVGQCGPNTIRTHIAPTVNDAAAEAGRPAPRIMALIRLCVTDDHAGAYALAREVGAGYARMPSYAAVLDREGLGEPADLHLIGSAEQVLDGLGRYAEAGVTDFRLEVSAHNEKARESSREALAGFLQAPG
ncbi:MAG: TIGR03564 family F420-dependent LLM class oxidoreductase [Acidimicrobiales bacterium]